MAKAQESFNELEKYVGCALRVARKKKHMKKEYMANVLRQEGYDSMDAAFIAAVERDQARIPFEMFKDFCTVLGCGAAYVIRIAKFLQKKNPQ